MVTNSTLLASSKKTSFTFLPVLTGLFTAALLISNILNSKVIRVGPLPVYGRLDYVSTRGVGGSNPLAPTTIIQELSRA